jgi:putative transposase
LRYLLTEFLEHYHHERPHQGRDNSPLTGPVALPRDDSPGPAEIACKKRLGGLLRHYHRRAA